MLDPDGHWRFHCSNKDGDKAEGPSPCPVKLFTASLLSLLLLVSTWLFLIPPGAGIEYWSGHQVWLDEVLHRNLVLRNKTLVKQEPPPELIAAYETEGESPEAVWLTHAVALDLRGRDLRRADFTGSELYKVDFGCRLEGSKCLNPTRLDYAIFRKTALHEADLSYARLAGADMREAQIPNANLTKAELRYANLSKADAAKSSFNLANLFGSHLEKAGMYKADLSWAKLAAAHLEETELMGATLKGAWMPGADLWKADLRRADFSWARLQGVDLGKTDMRHAKLKGAWMVGTSFWSADLRNADFNNAFGCEVDMGGATVYPESKKKLERDCKKMSTRRKS